MPIVASKGHRRPLAIRVTPTLLPVGHSGARGAAPASHRDLEEKGGGFGRKRGGERREVVADMWGHVGLTLYQLSRWTKPKTKLPKDLE